VSYTFCPTASDVRNVRAFKMNDTALEYYIDLAETSSFNFLTSSAIPSDTARKHLWALMAAHLATVMREPEPTAAKFGKVSVEWQGIRGASAAVSEDELSFSSPGKEFLRRWKRYNRGRVLR